MFRLTATMRRGSATNLPTAMARYATVEAAWPDALAVPASAILTEGDVNVGYKTFCFVVEHGRVKRTQVEVGARNDQLIELLRKRVAETGAAPRWEGLTGAEEIVRGELAGLQDGQTVDVRPPR